MSKFVRMMICSLALVLGSHYALPARADAADSVSEAARDTKKSIRKGTRKVKDKTCEMVDGKLSCAGKKLKHKAQNVGDDLSDKASDLKK